jgi:hypothetical protein
VPKLGELASRDRTCIRERSTHRLCLSVIALAEDFERHGAEAIERVRIEKPDAYLKVVAAAEGSQSERYKI